VIPEGKTVKQSVDIIKKASDIPQADFDTVLQNTTLLPAEANGCFEGWLFPATYEFEYNTTAQDIIKAMIKKTQTVLATLGISLADAQETITKASIVQREVTSKQDMAKVAQVIENRLAKNMPLGMDAIVGYGYSNGQGDAGLELPQSYLDDPDAPYNARLQTGLPNTPISNPGEDALKAVLKPTEGDWLYFVAVNPDTGETEFSETEAEFEASKAKYKAWLESKG
jgi:UPF0755 protein